MTSNSLVVPFEELGFADLVVGAVYAGGTAGHVGDDPLDKLLHCGNMGGFRFRGRENKYDLVTLFTTFEDEDWPDHLEGEGARFVYYGDNKNPGRELHDTSKGGNSLLRNCFGRVHIDPPRRDLVPPFFVFSSTGEGRDVRFHGLAAPGASAVGERDDLVAIWTTRGTDRFQNYRAVFTLLDCPRVPRQWVEALVNRSAASEHVPEAWRRWVSDGTYLLRSGITP